MIEVGGTFESTAVATIIATGITALAMILTQKSAARAAVRNAELTSRTDIELEAFSRAKGFYTDTIDRQDREIKELERDVDRLKARVAILQRDLMASREENEANTRELAAAKKLLRRLMPDEEK